MRPLALLVVLALAPRAPVSAQPVAPDSASAVEATAQTPDVAADSMPRVPELVDLQAIGQADGLADGAGETSEPNPVRLPMWVWALLVALVLAGLGAGIWQVVQRRRAAPDVPRPRPPGQSAHLTNFDRNLPPGEAARAPEMVPKAALDAERERADWLQQQLAAMQQRASTAPDTAATDPPAEAPPLETRAVPAAATGPSASDAVAEAFATWCRTGGGLVDKQDLFARQIAGLDATLEVVRRDQDSPARPVYFDADGGNSPAAHWLVRVGAEMLLLPQPQGPNQFRDLAPVFEGQAVPQSVQRVVPARVAVEGGGYVLTQPGRVA